MDADGPVEHRLGRPSGQRDGESLHDLRRIVAEHMAADHPIGAAVDDQLHEGLVVAIGQAVLQRPEPLLVDIDDQPALDCILLREADRGDRRRRKDRGGDVVEIDMARAAGEQPVGQRVPLGGGDRGRLRRR